MAAKHGLKYAVLGLVIERRGYGYQLAQRLDQLVGDAYQLRASAIYAALDQLEREGCIRATNGGAAGTARSPRVVYEATPAGATAFREWLRTPSRLEPVRGELAMKLGMARPEDAPQLLRLLHEAEIECIRLIQATACRSAERAGELGSWDHVIGALVHEHGIRQLNAHLAWLRDAREAVTSLVSSASAAPLAQPARALLSAG